MAKTTNTSLLPEMSAEQFATKMESLSSEEERIKTERYFKTGKGSYSEGDIFIGVRMGKVFELAKEYITMPIADLEKLLDNPIHEIRVGALSIMNQLGRKKITDSQREELYQLYLRKHDRINNWDLVDISCIYVVGRYLYDKPHDILYTLAISKNMWERRSAITATAYFMKHGDVADTFQIAALLLNDPEDLVHKATGGWLRQAGVKQKPELLKFLDKYAVNMPRTMLRYALEHFDAAEKKHYMEIKKKK